MLKLKKSLNKSKINQSKQILNLSNGENKNIK